MGKPKSKNPNWEKRENLPQWLIEKLAPLGIEVPEKLQVERGHLAFDGKTKYYVPAINDWVSKA